MTVSQILAFCGEAGSLLVGGDESADWEDMNGGTIGGAQHSPANRFGWFGRSP